MTKALVIGLSNYENIAQLDNPEIDADIVASLLKSSKYDEVTVVKSSDGRRAQLLKNWTNFLQGVHQGDEVVIFYSGHGVQVDGTDFIVPTDAPSANSIVQKSDAVPYLISIRELMKELSDHQVSVQVWIIDACREDPFASGRPWGADGGMESLAGFKNSVVLFSAAYGQKAADRLLTDKPGEVLGSPYVRTFSRLFGEFKSKPIYLFATKVGRETAKLMNTGQLPDYSDSMIDDWCFVSCEPDESVFPHYMSLKPENDLIVALDLEDEPFRDYLDLLTKSGIKPSPAIPSLARWFTRSDPFFPTERVSPVVSKILSHLVLDVRCFAKDQKVPGPDELLNIKSFGDFESRLLDWPDYIYFIYLDATDNPHVRITESSNQGPTLIARARNLLPSGGVGKRANLTTTLQLLGGTCFFSLYLHDVDPAISEEASISIQNLFVDVGADTIAATQFGEKVFSGPGVDILRLNLPPEESFLDHYLEAPEEGDWE